MKNLYFRILFITLSFMLLYVSPTLAGDIVRYKPSLIFGLIEVVKNATYLFISLYALFYGMSFYPIILRAGTHFIFLIGAIGSYYNNIFGIKISPELIKVALYNDVTEASELLSIKFIIWISISQIVAFFLTNFTNILHASARNKIASILLLLLASNMLIVQRFSLFERFQPWQITYSLTQHIKKAPDANKIDIANLNNYKISKDHDLTILVIGESARYDHFSLNGYVRETNPILSKIPGLFSFHAESCSNLTYLSVSCMLSRHGKSQFNISQNETSLISIFKKLGYKTMWIATQTLRHYFKDISGGSFYKEVDNLIMPGGSALYRMNAHDEAMLPFITDFINDKGKKLLIIHTSGSHWDYANRYPSDFAHFKPSCPAPLIGKRDHSDCDAESLKNIYDDSILYTDYFLSKVINLVANKEAFMIYTSDHGESLGENGVYGHGAPVEEQFQVPFIFWGSKAFLKHEPSLLQSLKQKYGLKLSHDYVFHSLLGCSGITSDMIDPQLNLCNDVASQ